MTDQRRVPAPELREVVGIRWDVDEEPVVRWDEAGRRFWLEADGVDDRIVLAEFDASTADPRGLAIALAEGLAACDFPPTSDAAAPGRVRATLRAAGLADDAERLA